MILSADAEEIMVNNIRMPTKTCGEAFFVDKVSAVINLRVRFIINLSLKMAGT
jgi:hypothetical protein